MQKQTRRERREEEARIVAEMDEAMQSQTQDAEAQTEEESKEAKTPRRYMYDETTPQQIHCRRCKTLMENGVCPVCGYRIYVPMAKEKRDKIRTIVAAVCMVAFIVLFVLLQAKKG